MLYKKLYGEGLRYIRPYDMFLSKVDKNKYPDVQQEYRFEFQELANQVKPKEHDM